MKSLFTLTLCVAFVPALGNAAALNLATLTCEKYESQVLPAAATNPTADSINTVMWLFGFSVAKSGAHVMYPDALAPFGFALDNECKSNPNETLLVALRIVKPETKNPMDLTRVQCSAFASRHVSLMQGDPESATTIMMWLFGFSVAISGSTQFDPESIKTFETALLAECAKQPDAGLLDALTDVKMSPPTKSPKQTVTPKSKPAP